MTTTDKLAVLGEISERARELEEQQSHATDQLDGTGRPGDRPLAEWKHRDVTELIATGMLTWRDELLDTVYQAIAEDDWPMLRDILLNVGAEAVVWIQHGDRRGASPDARVQDATETEGAALRRIARECGALRAQLDAARPVLEYVSRGRRYVDVDPYPDATARKVLGQLNEQPAIS